MKNYTVKKYESVDYEHWNAFIGKAKNATFLFHRDFMEYHNDRFLDCSLIVLDDEKWVAVLPAHQVEDVVFSHNGLTYGGLVYDEKVRMSVFLAVFQRVLVFLNEMKISKLHIKTIPSIYHNKPAEEINYALFLTNAKLFRRDTLSVIDLTQPYHISRKRREGIRRGPKNNLVIREELNFELFWNKILIPNLSNKHQANPVHTLAEIVALQKKFPNNIRHFNVYHNDEIVAGTTIFVSDNVAHPQYISGQSEKNELGSLDFLYHHLITEVFKEKNYFDFGISNEEQGRKLNEGLIFWKESFGTNVIIQDFYEVETQNFHNLDAVLL